MIWYFLAGFISGAVGWNCFVRWAGRKILQKQQMEAFRKQTGKEGKTL